MYSDMDYLFMEPSSEQEIDMIRSNNDGTNEKIKEAMNVHNSSLMSFFRQKTQWFPLEKHSGKQSSTVAEPKISSITPSSDLDYDKKALEDAQKAKLAKEYKELYDAYKDIYEKVENIKHAYRSSKANENTLLSNNITRSVFSALVPIISSTEHGRLSEISFINSVLHKMVCLESALVEEENNQHLVEQLSFAIVEIQKSHILLVGACFYIHQRIKEEYKGAKVNSELYNLLDKLLAEITLDKKTLALTHLSTFVQKNLSDDYDSEEEASIDEEDSSVCDSEFDDGSDFQLTLPCIKSSGQVESIETFMANIKNYINALCVIEKSSEATVSL